MDDLPLPWVIDLSRLCDLSHPPLRDPILRVGLVFYPRSGPPASFLDHPSAKAALFSLGMVGTPRRQQPRRRGLIHRLGLLF